MPRNRNTRGSQLTRLAAASLLLIGLAAAQPAAAGGGGGAADMSISKTASPDPAVFGEKLTYTVTVHNNGPGTATDVVGADRIPPEVKFESAKATKGGDCFVTSLVQCPIGTMANGETVTITIVVTVAEMPSEGDSIVNFCSVFSNNDPNDENSHCRVETKVVEDGGGPGEEPCIPERAFIELDGMQNFLRKTIKRLKDGELSEKQLKKRTKVLEESKFEMLRKHFPEVFGVKFVDPYTDLEGFDALMESVRRLLRISGKADGPELRTLKLAQPFLQGLEELLQEGEGVPEAAFTELDGMKNFLRKTIKRLKDGKLSAKQLKKRTRILEESKFAMLRAHFGTVCGVKFVDLYTDLEGFDALMESVRRLLRISGKADGPELRTLKLAQPFLQGLEELLEAAQ